MQSLQQVAAFFSGSLRAVELSVDDIPALQLFFETNPLYFMTVSGQPPRSNEAHEEFHDKVPEGMSFRKQWLLGFYDETGSMVAMASVISDFLTEDVWHIGLFIVDASLHGSGTERPGRLTSTWKNGCVARGHSGFVSAWCGWSAAIPIIDPNSFGQDANEYESVANKDPFNPAASSPAPPPT